MSALNLAGASVLPFQYPSLKDDGSAEPAVTGPVANGAVPTGIDAAATPPPPANGASEADSEHGAALAAELAGARAEGLQRGLAEGRGSGYAAGFAEGTAAAEAAAAEAAQRIAGVVAQLGGPLAAVERSVEESIVALALEVARCVIGDEVNRSREFLVRLVREAIAKVPLQMGVPRVLLNPADLDLIRRLAPEVEMAGAMLVSDETIETGGCVVIADGEDRTIKDRRWSPRSGEGASQVDLTLSSRWRAVMLTLFDGEDG
jgi:flagellar assembly protein FliH